MSNTDGKKKILIVLPAVPYPLRACGEALRYFPIIQHLSTRHDIHIIVISEFPVDRTSVKILEQYCQRVSALEVPKLHYSGIEKALTQATLLLPWTSPISFISYSREKIASEVRRLTSGVCYDVALWVSARHTVYTKAVDARRHVVDFIDSPTLHIQRRVAGSLSWPVLQRYEAWKMRRWETQLIRNMAASIYISPVDADAVPLEITSGHCRYIIPNGVSAEHYTPAVDERMRSPSIGFLGNMAYPPNIEAVHWLYKNVFLALREEIPDLSLYIIGKLPDDSILALGKQEGVVVTGEVKEVWPYINGVDVFVFPLWRGAGLKNKVLEAMYARRPVIASPIAAEGIESLPGRDMVVCNTQEEFVRDSLRLLRSPATRKELGESAHRLVTDRFSWQRIVREFERVLVGTDSTDRTSGSVDTLSVAAPALRNLV